MSATSPRRRATATSGTTRSPAAKPCQWRAPPPSGAKAKPPTATGPAPAGASGTPDSAPAASSRQIAAASSNRRGPPVRIARTQPSAASAAPSRSGCSKQNQGSPGRREANASALGSVAAGNGTVIEASTSPRAGARTPQRALAAREQLTAEGRRQRQRRSTRSDPDAHALQGTVPRPRSAQRAAPKSAA